MELDIFISETLISIIKGINGAQDYAKTNGARINPVPYNAPNETYVYYGTEEGKKPLSKIEFDIAVTASDKAADEAKGGITVFSIGLGARIENEKTNQTVSRIKFEIGAVLPFFDGPSEVPFQPRE